MLSTIRADFYRLFKTKGFWFSQLFIIGFIFISIASQSVGQVSVGTTNNAANNVESQFALQWTGIISVEAITSMMSLFFYAMLPMMVIIIGHDFSKKTYKNSLTVGVSRTKYFLSQYISFAVMIYLQIFYIYIVSFLTGTLFYGVGQDFNTQKLLDWVFTLNIQFLMIMAILTVSCFVTYTTKNNVLAILTAIILPVIIPLLGLIFKHTKWINHFDFQNLMSNTEFILSKSSDMLQSTYATIGTIVFFLVISIFQFNKSEL